MYLFITNLVYDKLQAKKSGVNYEFFEVDLSQFEAFHN